MTSNLQKTFFRNYWTFWPCCVLNEHLCVPGLAGGEFPRGDDGGGGEARQEDGGPAAAQGVLRPAGVVRHLLLLLRQHCQPEHTRPLLCLEVSSQWCTVSGVQSVVNSQWCTVCGVQSVVSSVQSMLYSQCCTLYSGGQVVTV